MTNYHDQLSAHPDRQNETKPSYITSSKMWKSGEWGGDIEIAAFSFIFQTNKFRTEGQLWQTTIRNEQLLCQSC